jgi:hypothetical protein
MSVCLFVWAGVFLLAGFTGRVCSYWLGLPREDGGEEEAEEKVNDWGKA